MDNAIYTPSPKNITVCVWEDSEGGTHVTDPRNSHIVDGRIIRTENARVTGRGNLLASGVERYYQVELSDGSRHMAISGGS